MAYVTAKDGGGADVKFKVDSVTDGADTVKLQKAGVAITYTNRSGTITTGGTAQQMMAAAPLRRKLDILNPKTETEDLWISFTTTATASVTTSFYLEPGDRFIEAGEGCTTQAVSVLAATTGHAWFAQEGV